MLYSVWQLQILSISANRLYELPPLIQVLPYDLSLELQAQDYACSWNVSRLCCNITTFAAQSCTADCLSGPYEFKMLQLPKERLLAKPWFPTLSAPACFPDVSVSANRDIPSIAAQDLSSLQVLTMSDNALQVHFECGLIKSAWITANLNVFSCPTAPR